MQAEREQDYRKFGLIGTVAFHTLLVLAFLFAVFTVPDPPLDGGSGVDLQYGVIGEEGFGDVQTTAPANESPNTEESRPAPVSTEIAQQPEEARTEKVDATEEKVVTTEEESPVNIKSVEKPTPKPVEAREEVKEAPKAISTYPGKSKVETGAGGTGVSNKTAGNNTGDRPGKVGDMGGPDGSMTGKDLYGKPGTGGPGNGGSGGKSGLDLPGWRYDVQPATDPFPDESGIVKFRIKIDPEGEIISVNVIEQTVSQKVVDWYRREIMKTSFSRLDNKVQSNQGATGTITFIIRSR